MGKKGKKVLHFDFFWVYCCRIQTEGVPKSVRALGSLLLLFVGNMMAHINEEVFIYQW